MRFLVFTVVAVVLSGCSISLGGQVVRSDKVRHMECWRIQEEMALACDAGGNKALHLYGGVILCCRDDDRP